MYVFAQLLFLLLGLCGSYLLYKQSNEFESLFICKLIDILKVNLKRHLNFFVLFFRKLIIVLLLLYNCWSKN